MKLYLRCIKKLLNKISNVKKGIVIIIGLMNLTNLGIFKSISLTPSSKKNVSFGKRLRLWNFGKVLGSSTSLNMYMPKRSLS